MAFVSIKPFSYTDNHAPEAYKCYRCDKTNVRLWRDYQTFLENQELYCVECALLNQDKDAEDLLDGDQIGWLVPAVPTEDGETFWGYTPVPMAGVEWWYRLSCAVPVRPDRESKTAEQAAEVDARFEREKQERRRRDDAELVSLCNSAIVVIKTMDELDQTELWSRWVGRKSGGQTPIRWDQIFLGMMSRAGGEGDREVWVSTSFARIEGSIIAFVETTSQAADDKMVTEWTEKKFPNAKRMHPLKFKKAVDYSREIRDLEDALPVAVEIEDALDPHDLDVL